MVAAVSNTAYGIIHDAMVDAGKLRAGSQPNSDELASNLRRLCDLINLWQTDGLKLFLLQEITIPLVVSQSTYTVGTGLNVDMTKPLQVLQGYVLDTSAIRRPVVMISWNDWMLLPQVADNDGTISSVFVDKQATKLNVHVWNAPDTTEAANDLKLLVRTQATNPVNLEESVSFPQEWRIALRWGLADDICTGQPSAIMERCQQKAEYYRERLEAFDVEDTTTSFAPDMQGYNGGGFR